VGRESASENAQSDTALLVAVVINLVLVVAGMVVEAPIRPADLVRDTEVRWRWSAKPCGRIVHWLPATAFDSASSAFDVPPRTVKTDRRSGEAGLREQATLAKVLREYHTYQDPLTDYLLDEARNLGE